MQIEWRWDLAYFFFVCTLLHVWYHAPHPSWSLTNSWLPQYSRQVTWFLSHMDGKKVKRKITILHLFLQREHISLMVLQETVCYKISWTFFSLKYKTRSRYFKWYNWSYSLAFFSNNLIKCSANCCQEISFLPSTNYFCEGAVINNGNRKTTTPTI